jgi:hypothetical protein
MGRGIIEWPSNDVLQRKYSNSWAIFEDANSKLAQVWVDTCEWTGNEQVFYSGDFQWKGLKPVYFNVEAGYYVVMSASFLLERKFTNQKNFRVGVSDSGWNLSTVDPSHYERNVEICPQRKLDLLNPPDPSHFKKKGVGVISRNYFMAPSHLFYRGCPIGSREGNIILLDDISFKKDITNVLGPIWQVS